MRLRFVVNRRVPPVPSPVLTEASALLRRDGFDVHACIPEEHLTRPDTLRPDADLYVMKSHTELAFSLAGALLAAGARQLNPYRSWAATQDKLVACRYLRAAGVPAPRCWLTADLSLLAGVVDDTPLVVKPHRGHRGAGVRLVRDAAELAAVELGTDPVIVQEHVPGPGEDLKVYVVGDEVFAVRKPFSATSFTRPGRPCAVDGGLAEIARRCGRALGLGLYGLDVIDSADGPVVVDVNYFPGYKGVPGAAGRIADYVAAYARGEVRPPAPLVAAPAEVAVA
jgi:ribosomal protein S6--L-glutamate ligase